MLSTIAFIWFLFLTLNRMWSFWTRNRNTTSLHVNHNKHISMTLCSLKHTHTHISCFCTKSTNIMKSKEKNIVQSADTFQQNDTYNFGFSLYFLLQTSLLSFLQFGYYPQMRAFLAYTSNWHSFFFQTT